MWQRTRRMTCYLRVLSVLCGEDSVSCKVGKTKTRRTEPGLEEIQPGSIESGSVRLFRLGDVLSLGAFLSLHDFKLYVITFLKALVAVRLDGAIVNKNIRAFG